MSLDVPVAAPAPRLSKDAERSEAVAAAHRLDRRMTIAMLTAHGLGAFDVFVLLFFVLPAPAALDGNLVALNMVGFAVYLFLAAVAGWWIGSRRGGRAIAWLREGREPTRAEQEQVLRQPIYCTIVDGGFWMGAIVLFWLINAPESQALAAHVGVTILLGGITTCAIAFLVTERIFRPVTAAALRIGPPAKPVAPGVKGRLVLTWASASGVPLIGMILVACDALTGSDVTTERLAWSALILGVMGLVTGAITTLASSYSVAKPVNEVRRGMARLANGDLRATVRVDDGSEIGLLQSGFNSMAAGLEERERLRSLLDRSVGHDVARVALDEEPSLGGSVREVAVLFVDLVGSTTMAASRPPDEVVAMLNRFFAIVVDTVESHGGLVNKFEGDAALCIFGAPTEHPDCAARALRAARDLRARLAYDLPSADAGIGLSAGPAVAGWIGHERRFEYTVIGDPVNEAARLCELAKRRHERVLASDAITERAEAEEVARWRDSGEETLRGRSAPTRIAVPA